MAPCMERYPPKPKAVRMPRAFKNLEPGEENAQVLNSPETGFLVFFIGKGKTVVFEFLVGKSFYYRNPGKIIL